MPAPLDRGEKSFTLGSSTRTTLSAILIVHPVAAFLTLVMFVLAIVAHLHAPSHSARYLLALFIVGLVDFLVCLLCFLVDVLLFVPHMAWGSYIVLAATILVAISGLVSCAMRRTIVSRKARKKRIAENAEMSGENYYNRQAQVAPVAPASAPSQPTVPMLSGANGAPDTLPEFATFEKKDDHSSEERIPLTARSPSDRSQSNTYVNDTSTISPVETGPSRSLTNTPIYRDQYGNPMQPPQDAYAMGRVPSQERMNARGRGGMVPRGRGGFPGPGRGGYNGYGPGGPNGRGGYGGPVRGRGGYGPPPRGYGGGGQGMRGGRPPPPPGYHGQGGPGPYDRRGSPAGPYGGPGPYNARQPSPGPQSAPGYPQAGVYEAYSADNLPRAESPPPLPGIDDGVSHRGAIEMDATSGNTAQTGQGYGQYGIRDSDADVAGMLAMQQARISNPDRHDTYVSESSKYSNEECDRPIS